MERQALAMGTLATLLFAGFVGADNAEKKAIVSGKIVNHKGEPVPGANLRLIAAIDRPRVRERYPFTWDMIETGYIEQAYNVLQVQKLTSGADGGFVFQGIPSEAEIELVYWAKGISPGRVDHLEKLSVKERTSLVVKALAPARIKGTIDRKVFPWSKVQLSRPFRFYQAKVSVDGSFLFDDLAPGDYEVEIFLELPSKNPFSSVNANPYAMGLSGTSKGFTTQPHIKPDAQTPLALIRLGGRSVTLEEGKETQVMLGAGDIADRTPQFERNIRTNTLGGAIIDLSHPKNPK